MNKRKLLCFAFAALLFAVTPRANAQQYGWVRIAQIGNQFNTLQSVEFVDSLYGWVGDGTTGFHYTQDGGNSWFPGSGATVVPYAISMLNRSVGWAAGWSGSFGGIHKTTDGGLSWTQQYYVINRNYLGTAGLTLGKNITSGYTSNFSPDTGKIVQTSNGGDTWTERTIADSIIPLKVQFIDSLRGWIIAGVRNMPGGILRTTDGGQSWLLYAPTAQGFQSICFIDTSRGWAVAAGTPNVYKTTNAGMTWSVLSTVGTQNEDFSAAGLSFVDSLHGWAFGLIFFQGDLAAAIYKTTDGGMSWLRELAGGGSRGVTGIMLDKHHGWAVGSLGAVFAYRIVSSVPERVHRVPKSFALKQNYPNPFNSTTSIEYELVQRSHVNLTVYDINGKEVNLLISEEQEPGVYRVHVNAQGLASGTYYYTMKTDSFAETKQMVLVK